MAFESTFVPASLSNDTPIFWEIAAASASVKGTSPRNLRYTASLPKYNISISVFAKLVPFGNFSFIALINSLL